MIAYDLERVILDPDEGAEATDFIPQGTRPA
jgi:hypothetical protein